MGALIGREAELAAVARLLGRATAGFGVLVLEGDAGIGKTMVWRDGLRQAQAVGFTILAARPVEAERTLSFAALGDLLDPVPEDVIEGLREPQRLALEVALLRRRPPRAGAPARAIGAALAGVLGELATANPVLLAIDDVQWLDAASAAAVAFALRRLESRPIAILVGQRIDDGRAPHILGLDHDAGERVERLRLGPLSLGALYHLIHDRFGSAYARPTLQRIHQASGGNPLFAIELARGLAEVGGRPGPGEPLPIPETLSGLIDERVGRQSAATRRALLAAALLADATIARIEAVLGSGDAGSLARAARSGLIETEGGRVRFAHPLFATAVAAMASPSARRDMHRRLAAVVEEPEAQARHLAIGADGPSEDIAARLEVAAAWASRRGATHAAAELVELAVQLTPATDTATIVRRRLDLADAILRAGDTSEARRIVTELLDEVKAGPLRARTLEFDARLRHVGASSADAAGRADEALDHVGDDPHLRARVHATLALVEYDDVARAHRHARAALDLLEAQADPDPEVHAVATMAFAEAEVDLHGSIPMAAVERGLASEALAPAPNVGDRLSSALGVWLKYSGQFDDARRWLERTHRAAIDEGDEGSMPYALSHLPQLELWTGHWAAAERWALEHLEVADRTNQPGQRLQAAYNLATVLAHMGRVNEARALVEQSLRDCDELGDGWYVMPLSAALGFIHLSCGDGPAAVRALETASRIHEESGARAPHRSHEDYVEGLVLTGDLETAELIADRFESRSRSLDQAMTLAPALRGRAILAAAHQDLDRSTAALDEAIVQHGRTNVPFSLARTLLVQGQVLRRRGERRASREALNRSLAIFDELGAPLWAARAEAELGRLPIRRGAGEGLTPTEERVAALAGQGMTNRQIASQLFLSPKTVEANLTRIYGKLGVSSRTALAARLSTPPAEGSAPKV